MSITIRLPWPSTTQSPNGSHGHWSQSSGARKKYKIACAKECMVQGIKKQPFAACDVTVKVFPPNKSRRDLDNVLASIKTGLDAIADAIGVDDGKWHELHIIRSHVVKGGAIEVVVLEHGQGQAEVVPFEGIINVGGIG